MVPGSSKKLVPSRARSSTPLYSFLNLSFFSCSHLEEPAFQKLTFQDPTIINPNYSLLVADPIRGTLKQRIIPQNMNL